VIAIGHCFFHSRNPEARFGYSKKKAIKMDQFTKIITLIHISLGALSLVLFWLPVFTRKGGKLHRKIGKWYVYFMWGVVITAAALSIKNILIGEITTAIFLGFLTLITANPLWYGIAMLKNKKGISDTYKQMHFSFNILIILFSVFMLVYAIIAVESGASILLSFFALLGLSSAPQIIRDYKSQLSDKSWFKEHYQGMIISWIAAYTAFFAFGGRQVFEELLTGYWQIVPWILPTLIGFVGLRYTRKYYERKGILKKSTKPTVPLTSNSLV